MKSKKLKDTLKKYDRSKQSKETLISGLLGITLGGTRIVEVPNRKGFCYVRIKGNTSELIQAFNATVSPVYDLPVFIVRQNNIYKVVGRNIDRYTNQFSTEAPYLPKHGAQHSFNRDIGAGGDVVWVYSQQFMPMLSYPSGSVGSMTLAFQPGFYEWNGQWRYAQNTGTPSYTPYLPAGAGNARMVLSYLDPTDNSIKLVAGTPFSNSLTGSSQVAQYIPDIPREIGLPLAAVRLVTGTTSIGWDSIYDLRDFWTVGKPSGSSGGAGGISGIVAWDEGVVLGTGTVLNFVGSNVVASISGTVINVFVTGSTGGGSNPPVTGSIVVQENGQTLGSALVLNAGSKINLTMSGTIANIDADAVYLRTDDFSSQTSNTGTVYLTTYPPDVNTARLYYNGLRQRYLYHYTITGSTLFTLFTPTTGSVLLLDYNESYSSGTVSVVGGGGGGGLGIVGQDEGVYVATGTILNVVGSGATLTASGTVLNLNIPAFGGGNWNFIQQVSLSNTGTITFSNIPQTYTSLVLQVYARTAQANATDQLDIRFGNSTPDSGANYSYAIRREGFAQGTSQSVTATKIDSVIIPGNTATTGYYGYVTYLIDGYAENHWKDIQIYGGHTDNAGYRINTGLATWRSNSPIDTIFCFGEANTSFVSGSYARLYGISSNPPTSVIPVQDEGVYLATGTVLNFVGSGVTATASGTVINVEVPGAVFTDYSSSSTVLGWTTPTVYVLLQKRDRLVNINFRIAGTSNNASGSFTVPYPLSGLQQAGIILPTVVTDNGTSQASPGRLRFATGTFSVNLDKAANASAGWTASGNKVTQGSFSYFTDI